ncbi:MAG: hypothetical protein ACPGRE_01425 [Flavobacteriaceae bacterium]
MKNIYTLLIVLLTMSSCSESSTNIPVPEPAALVFPLNNSECLDGEQIDEDLTSINFQWEVVEHAVSYNVVLTNLSSGGSTTNFSNTNSLKLNLERGQAYSWSVESVNDEGESSTSDSWSFYSEGQAVESHVPFPAEAYSPVRGAHIDAGSVSLRWTAVDLDDDVEKYVVYHAVDGMDFNMGDEVITPLNVIDTESGKTYYWKVKTFDQKGNSSISEVFEFKTN